MKKDRITNTNHRMCFAFLISFLITSGYLLWAYHNFPFIYDIIDDIIMRDIASGVTTGSPDGHLMYIKFLLGSIFSILYRFLPGADWYVIFLLSCLCLSLMTILYRGLVLKRSIYFKLLYIFTTLLVFT